MTHVRWGLLAASAAVVMVTVACSDSGEPSAGSASGDAGGTAPQSAASPTGATESGVNITPEILTAFERGFRRELDAVREAQRRSREATTPQERGEAIQASFEHATIPKGADAAGLPVDQYTPLRQTIDEIFRTLDFQGKIDGPLSMDLSRVDEATRQRLSRDPFADLAPGSAAALRANMDRLLPLWIEYMNLTAVAG